VDFVRPSRSVALRFVSGRGHYDTVIESVRTARTSVWIATANLKELMVEDQRWSLRRTRRGVSYRSVIEVFDELVLAGVEIRLLHAALASRPFRAELARHSRLTAFRAVGKLSRSAAGRRRAKEVDPQFIGGPGLAKMKTQRRAASGVFATMRDSGPDGAGKGSFEMRLCPRVHLKTVIVDGAFLYLGSANWTGAGLGVRGAGRRNFELGIVTDDAPLLDDVQEIFDGIWRGSECAGCKLRNVCPHPLDRVSTTRPRMSAL
jgi:phosphatidylserine/phosphatidylglycerophosphate/cardiolipin synthase-like enzyme